MTEKDNYREKHFSDVNDDCPFKHKKHSSYCLIGDCMYYDKLCPILKKHRKLIDKKEVIP